MSYIGKQPTKAPLTASDIEDGIITAAKIEDGAVVAAEIASNAVTTAKINADAVTGAKIADDAINSEHYTDGSVDTAHIADANITTAKIADDAVTAAKINNDIISGSTELASEPADTDEFLVSDAGTLKRIDYSLIKGGGITMADQFRLTTSYTNPDDGFITTNLERNDTSGYGQLGTGMTESSGVFSFPSTGIYLITYTVVFNITSTDQDLYAYIYNTVNNSSYTASAVMRSGGQDSARADTSTTSFIFDVTNTTNCKVKFYTESVGAGTIVGNSAENYTHMTFLRLGDT